MRAFGQLLAGRLVIALAIVFAVLSAPIGASAFHDAVAEGHVLMVALDDHDRGHSHDLDDETTEVGPTDAAGDHHKHNPGDHSHEKLWLAPDIAAVFDPRVRSRLLTLADAALRGLSITLDRPPRASPIA